MKPYLIGPELAVIILGDMVSPGVVTLSGHDRFKNWDVQKASGTAGATTKLQGDDPGEFQASFYLAADNFDGEEDDFDRWEEFKRLVNSLTESDPPKTLPIYHPELESQGFTEVTSGGVGGLLFDDRGGATGVIRFREYFPAKPKPAAKAVPGEGVRVGVTTLSKPDPNIKAKQELAALLDEAGEP